MRLRQRTSSLKPVWDTVAPQWHPQGGRLVWGPVYLAAMHKILVPFMRSTHVTSAWAAVSARAPCAGQSHSILSVCLAGWLVALCTLAICLAWRRRYRVARLLQTAALRLRKHTRRLGSFYAWNKCLNHLLVRASVGALRPRAALDNEDPIAGCQIGDKCPVLHAKWNQVYPFVLVSMMRGLGGQPCLHPRCEHVCALTCCHCRAVARRCPGAGQCACGVGHAGLHVQRCQQLRRPRLPQVAEGVCDRLGSRPSNWGG
jgi:hypothetical protein